MKISPFRIDLYSSDEKLKSDIDYIDNQISGSSKIYIRLILENFYQSNSDIIFFKKIPLDRYNHRNIIAGKLKKICYKLEKINLIKIKKNFKFEKYRFSFCIEKTKKLDNLLKKYKFKSSLDPWRELIVLRSYDKKLKDYKDNKETILMRSNLEKINKFYYFQSISFKNQKVDPSLKRVFNNSFKHGGRFYGDHQRLSSKERSELLINNKKVTEADFKGIAIKLIYLREGINYVDDPYIIDSYEHLRKIFKISLQIIINAKNKKSALYAIKDNLSKEKITPLKILELLENKHSKISKYFYSGIGTELQKEDSIICEKILLECVRQNIVALSVHDSFIVEKTNKDKIIRIMKKVSKDLYNIEFEVS